MDLSIRFDRKQDIEKIIKNECTSLIRAADAAEKLMDAGYQKIVWHKVADEDLPIMDDWYICALTDGKVTWTRPMKFRQNTFVIPEDPRVFDKIAHKQVIAWTELSKYKE